MLVCVLVCVFVCTFFSGGWGKGRLLLGKRSATRSAMARHTRVMVADTCPAHKAVSHNGQGPYYAFLLWGNWVNPNATVQALEKAQTPRQLLKTEHQPDNLQYVTSFHAQHRQVVTKLFMAVFPDMDNTCCRSGMGTEVSSKEASVTFKQ